MDYDQIDAENEKFSKRLNEDSIKAGGPMKEVTLAVLAAKQSAKEDGLLPIRDEFGEWKYSADQGAMASCFAREDAAATLILQKTQLEHLHVIKALLWGCIGVLGYIAYKVS